MMNVEFLQYVKPELFIILPVLYIIGLALKATDIIKDRYIPLALGGISIFICLLHFLASTDMNSVKSVFEILFASIVQGVLIAACSTYANQIIKQSGKKE